MARHRQQSPCCRLLNRQPSENVPMDPASDFDLLIPPLEMWTKELCYEANRLKTFENNWPHSFLKPHILAKTGLFFSGNNDAVVCYFCEIHLSEWSPNDTEISRHGEHSRCRLLLRKSNENIPLEPVSDLDDLLPPQWWSISVFRFEEKRLKTFYRTWHHLRLSPRVLAKTGLFYTGDNDKVVCYFCGIHLSDWTPNDKEIARHRRESSHCCLLNRQLNSNISMEPASDFDELCPPSENLSGDNLRYEEHRLKTFEQDWTHEFLDPKILAKTGLYFSGVKDTVVCYFCEIHLSDWTPIEIEILRHRRHSPRCRLLNRWPNPNIPMEPTAHFDKLCPPLKTSTNDLRYEVNLLRTFDHNWPHSVLNPELLASNGLYFTGANDTVVCYFCGVHFSAWLNEQFEHISRHNRQSSCRLIHRGKASENVSMNSKQSYNINQIM